MKMTTISRSNHALLGREFVTALKDLGDKFGIDIKSHGGIYGEATGVIKLQVDIRDAGAGVSGKEAEFIKYASYHGLAPSDFGRVFEMRGVQYRISGYNIGKPKFNISGVALSNKRTYGFCSDDVKSLLTRMPIKAAA